MKQIIIILALIGLLSFIGFNEVDASKCISPHCYAQWTHGTTSAAEGIQTDLQVSDIYIKPDSECKNNVVESIWMQFSSSNSANSRVVSSSSSMIMTDFCFTSN